MVFRVGNLAGVLEVSAKGQIPSLQLGRDRNDLQTAIVFVATPVQETYAALSEGSKRYFLENRGVMSINSDHQSVDESVALTRRSSNVCKVPESRLELEAVAFYGATTQAITHEDCF